MDAIKVMELRSKETDDEKSSRDQNVLSLIPIISSITLCDEVDNANYYREAVRLQSFQNWPLSYLKAEKLAAAGFYYTGHNDRVKCFECKIELQDWTENDDPMVDHQRWSPRCRFIRKMNCDNVPIGVDPNTITVPTSRSVDLCGYGLTLRITSGPDNHSFSDKLLLLNVLNPLELTKYKAPVHPEYNTYDARLRTFHIWPKSLLQIKEQLSEAGFYYTGQSDKTSCFHCGGGLKEWGLQDDPWEEHAKWFSKCFYLLTVKGESYVSRIIGQNVSSPPIEKAMQVKLSSPVTNTLSVKPEKGNEAGNDPGPSSSQIEEREGIENCTGSTNTVATKLEMKEQSGASQCINDTRLCKICYNAELGVVFLPCGHIVACVKCAPSLKTCVVCRNLIYLTVRAFLS